MPITHVKYLQVTIDRCINTNVNAASVCKTVIFRIFSLKAFSTQETPDTVIYDFVTFCIELCNSIFYGVSGYDTDRVQKIRNALKWDQITPQFFIDQLSFQIN